MFGSTSTNSNEELNVSFSQHEATSSSDIVDNDDCRRVPFKNEVVLICINDSNVFSIGTGHYGKDNEQ